MTQNANEAKKSWSIAEQSVFASSIHSSLLKHQKCKNSFLGSRYLLQEIAATIQLERYRGSPDLEKWMLSAVEFHFDAVPFSPSTFCYLSLISKPHETLFILITIWFRIIFLAALKMMSFFTAGSWEKDTSEKNFRFFLFRDSLNRTWMVDCLTVSAVRWG